MYDLLVSSPQIFQNKSFYIVDSNPRKWLKTLRKIRIYNPKVILELENPIICVTSRLFTIQEDILKSIESLRSRLKTIKLFGKFRKTKEGEICG